MPRVLLVYFEPQSSGQTTHVLSLAGGLNKDKYEITVVLPKHLQNNIDAFNQTGVTTVPLTMGKIFWNPKSMISLMNLIRRQGIDIVHVHSQEAGLLVRIIARLAGAKTIIYTPQCTNIRNDRWFWFYRLIEKYLSFITDTIISVNGADRLRIIEWGIPSSKVVTIKNGIGLSLFMESIDAEEMKRKMGLDEKQPVVMQVGRLNNQKDPLTFMNGASRVADEHPEVQFVLVGDGPLKDELERHIQELGLNDQFHCLGWQDNGYKLIAMADIISLTSRWEGLPYVLLEAMAWSCPVVATAVNGCPEVVQDGISGYLIPKENAAAWAKSVIKLLENPERSVEMGRRGNERLKEEFSLKKMVEQTERLYDELTFKQLKASYNS
jgi:glycosyltransferase involved in cell wall biosynthesis